MVEEENKKLVECPRCNGKGDVEIIEYPASGAELTWVVCAVCNGYGIVTKKKQKEYLERIK